MSIRWMLFLVVLPCFVQAEIIQSATYTQQGAGDLSIDFDNLSIQGQEVVDWMIFDDAADDKIYAQKTNATYLISPEASGASGATNLYDFSWSDGDPIEAGDSVAGLGFSGYGTYRFKTSVPVDFAGIFRLYVGSVTNDTYTISTVYAGDDLTVNVGSNTFGFIDINFSNNSAYAETIYVSIDGGSGVEPHFYANAVSQIPEPRVFLFLGASIGLFFGWKRIFGM